MDKPKRRSYVAARNDYFLAVRCAWCGVYGLPQDMDKRGMCLTCRHHYLEAPSGDCRACGLSMDMLYDGYCADCWMAIEEELTDYE